MLIKAALLLSLFSLSLNASEYIVKLKASRNKGVSELTSIGKLKKLHRSAENLFIFKTENKVDILNKVKSLSEVEYIEPNYKYYPLRGQITSDPLSGQQWGLHNIRRTIFGSKRGADINVLKAWELTKGSKNVVIAVIDSGLDIAHPDLKDTLWINQSEVNGIDGVDDDQNGYIDDFHGYDFIENSGYMTDNMGHGTHCSGVIGASHNDVGIAGVMGKVQIMALKFFNGDGGDTINAVKAIHYAVDNGAQIISNSWGGSERSFALEEAIEYANSKGVLFVAAAGNFSENSDQYPLYPASYQIDNVISVGAINVRGKRSSISNYGKQSVHVFAPGENILSTVQLNSYLKFTGTSMATPHVSAIAGLMISLKEGLTPKEIKEILIKSSKQSKYLINSSVSGGTVDAYQALLAM